MAGALFLCHKKSVPGILSFHPVRKERYHCYSLDAMQYGDKDKFMPYSEESPDWLMEQEEYSDHINRTFARLSEVQQRRMLMLASGMSMHEIADREGVDYRAVYDSVKAARKKFLKYFKNTSSNRPKNLRRYGRQF